jgi:hypothetical protein
MNEVRLIGRIKKIGTVAVRETIHFRADAMNGRRPSIHRVLGQSAAAVIICMMRPDDTLGNVEDEWAVKGLLLETESSLHQCADDLLVLRQGSEKALPPTQGSKRELL